MKKISEDDLTLLYYGEHDDPALAATVAGSEELSARFDALCEELKRVDSFLPPEPDEDYGAEVWRRISPKLAAESATSGGAKNTFGRSWFSVLSQPRFSLAGVFSLVVVAVLAFMLGRNGVQQTNVDAPDLVANPATLLEGIDLAGINSEQLLARTVSGHLEQVNLVLTQFANMTESSPTEAEWATDMLVANRLYRQVASKRGNHKLAAFLADLEPLLIEMAYQAHTNSPATRERMQQEVKDGLLFRVRVMANQLNKPGIST